MMHRLAIAREDPSIREAVPANSFRSQAQAIQEAHMMRAAAMAKARNGRAGVAGTGSGAGAGAGAGRPPSGTQSQQQQAQSRSAPPRKLTGMNMNFQGSVPAAAAPAPVPASPAPPTPQLPFVFRRAAFDVQITDPLSGDILQLDQGTWVLSSANPNPRTRMLNVYTTDPDNGTVLTYELPIPDGNLNNVFDRHTLNVIETMMGGASAAGQSGSGALGDDKDGEMDLDQASLESSYAM